MCGVKRSKGATRAASLPLPLQIIVTLLHLTGCIYLLPVHVPISFIIIRGSVRFLLWFLLCPPFWTLLDHQLLMILTTFCVASRINQMLFKSRGWRLGWHVNFLRVQHTQSVVEHHNHVWIRQIDLTDVVVPSWLITLQKFKWFLFWGLNL